jgi:hypothetical protein
MFPSLTFLFLNPWEFYPMIRKVSSHAALAAIIMIGFGGSTALAAKAHAGHHKKHRPKTAIAVTVVDSSGNPVEGAKVHLGKPHHKAKHHNSKKHASHPTAKKHKPKHHVKGHGVTTDSSGHATLHGTVGSHHVHASKSGVGAGGATVSVTTGQDATVTVKLGKHHHGHKGHGKHTGKKHHSHVTPSPGVTNPGT